MYEKCINSIAVVICEVVNMLNIVQTVQTSWRPQLPLPKEVVPPTASTDPNTRSSEMNRHSNAAASNGGSSSNRKDAYHSAQQIGSSGGNKNKWSFGRLFRKKKDAETESSSEEDRKAGFVTSPKYRKKDKKKRGSKLIGSGFDHIVVSPTRDNEFFLPFEPVSPVETQPPSHLSPPVDREAHSRSTNSLDRRSKHDRRKSGVRDPQHRHSSSEEEMVSLNSSTTFTKYRSDESLGSGGAGNNGNGQSRRSRAARNERYYKRLSRDGEVSHGQAPVMYAPQPAPRWKTQPVPLSIFNEQAVPQTGQPVRPLLPVPTRQEQKMRNSTSLSHVTPQYPVTYGMPQPPKNLQNTVNDGKRSISYDSHIHLQNIKKPMPPPPPPRDPLRRVNVTGHDHRPISYAFDQNSSHAPSYSGMSGRCVSDDRIWSGTAPLYQSASSINNPPSVVQNRRFITRAERDAHPAKKSLPSGIDYRYVAEAVPRSRKPIHLVNQEQEDAAAKPPSPVVIRTTKSGLPDPGPANTSNPHQSADYWTRGRNPAPRSEASFNKPRSVSSSRAGELRSYNMPMYSEVSKPKKQVQPEETAHVVSGSLLIKPSKDNQNNYVEIHNNANKSNSMPNHYQRRDLGAPRAPKADSPTPNKYDEYVAEKRVRNILDHSLKVAPDPPQRKAAITKEAAAPPAEPDVIMRKKPTNLEDAINELEAIYKSLKLGDESLMDRAERRDIPTPTNFEKYAELHADEFNDDDDDEPAGEPDVVRDDYAYRNFKHTNVVPKSTEKQPPFGIPIGPIVPSPRSDYLHVQPEKDSHKVRTAPFKYPDIVSDDLAVRTLRKEPPGQVKPQFLYPAGSLKKKRATRTQSANIYSLIQRNAAKPSGGDIRDYMELTKSLERAGSMSDIHKETDDIPSTLQLLRNLREQDQASAKVPPFRHPNQGGAISDLPTVLSSFEDPPPVVKAPIPLPRKSVSPDPEKTKMEDALNKIAKEAKESSEKLTRELMELRKEALITSSRPKAVTNPSIERDLEQIEAVSEAAKRCRHILMETLPPDQADADAEKKSKQTPPRRLVTEDKLIKAIDQVSDAANKVCEKILNEIVTVQPPVIVQNAIAVKNRPKQELVMPSLIQKLDPSSARIGEIAERCMRQISELNDMPDYDNLHQMPAQATACNTTKPDSDRQKRSDADLLIVPGSRSAAAATENEEEIDKIMKECEEQARDEATAANSNKLSVKPEDRQAQSDDAIDAFTGKMAITTTSASSSSDCLKSSSPSAGPHLSSSITSFNPYSSSDYIMSPSSEFHAPSTDPIKTFSTTSYDVQSSSVTPNITNSPFSYTPSPPLNRTPVCCSSDAGEKASDSASQYNSSEELAMIFGIEKTSPTTTTTGKDDNEPVLDLSVPIPVGVLRCSEPNKPDTTTTTTATNPELCESVLVCKLDTIEECPDEGTPPPSCQVSTFYLPSYASNISIIVTSVGDDGAEDGEELPKQQQFDSLSSMDDSSNPDSGNVSLSDFPPLSPINASLEVELAHNSRFEVAKFVNEVTITNSGCPEMDYLRSLFADDEVSTSFSFEDAVLEELDDHYDNDDDRQVDDTKDQYSPGHLLNEVLSQVSRINAGTNRRQLMSQLENISECTKIVEDLSDRLSHHSSQVKNRDDRERVRERRVRFSDEYETDQDDHSDCLRSLKEIGHHLSSSEESIPPLGEIFSVPITDSENDGEDEGEISSIDRDSSVKPLDHPALNFDETQKSFREECKLLKEALHKVVHSGLIGLTYPLDVDESDVASDGELDATIVELKPIVSVVDVVDCVDSGVQIVEVEDDSLTLSSEMVSIIEVADFDEKDDPQLRSLLGESPPESSEVVSIVEVVDSDSCPNAVRFERLHSDEVGRVSDPQSSEERSSDLEDRQDVTDFVVESEQGVQSLPEEIACQGMRSVRFELSGAKNLEFREISDLELVDIACQRVGLHSKTDHRSRTKEGSDLELVDIACQRVGLHSQTDHRSRTKEGSDLELVDIACQRVGLHSSSGSDPQEISNSESDSILSSSEEELPVCSPQRRSFAEKAYLSPVNISLKIVNQVSRVRYVDYRDAESLDRFSEVADQVPTLDEDHECTHASEIVVVESTHESDLDKVTEVPVGTSPASDIRHSEDNPDSQSLLRYRPSSSSSPVEGDTSTPTQVPTPTPKTLSLLAQPRNDDRMTTLEHILLACTVGVVTGNDLITMLAIIIGVLTIIAIVLL